MSATPTAGFVAALLAVLTASLVAIALAFALFWWRERRTTRRLRQQLHEERRRADAAISAGDTFFDLVSHELRSPIAAIVGYQELLSDGVYGTTDAGAAEPLERIGRSAQHLLHLVDGVIDLARLRATGLTAQPGSVDLHHLLQDVARDLERSAEERSIPHHVDLEAGLPTIRSDLQRLQRALHLMVMVAVKHPAAHGEPLELSAARDGDGVTIRIRGTSIPLHAESQDPVVRTGIRIAVVSAMAELLGGHLALACADDRTVSELALVIPGL